MYRKALFCPLKCESENSQKDDIKSHILACKALRDGVQQPLTDIYSDDILKQEKVAQVICTLVIKRNKLQEDCETNRPPGASFLDLFSRLQQLLVVATVN